jgi:hypothetical protein
MDRNRPFNDLPPLPPAVILKTTTIPLQPEGTGFVSSGLNTKPGGF